MAVSDVTDVSLAEPAFNRDDLLWRHLKTVPAFRALLRATEARLYQRVRLPEPILDLGCGDGHFAQMAFDEPLAAGIDPWWGPLRKAQRTGCYRNVAQTLGNKLPFQDVFFGAVISNSVLEHIAEVDEVLVEANRVLRPGGKLVITMPSHLFTEWLGGATILRRAGLTAAAAAYRRFFNFIARHAHTDSPAIWAGRLADAGFSVERWQYYFSRKALWALEWGHVQGLPSAALHFLTGHWIVAPWESNLKRTEQWVRPYYEEEVNGDGAYIFILASKQASGPIDITLPPPQPFTAEEVMSLSVIQESGEDGDEPAGAPPVRRQSPGVVKAEQDPDFTAADLPEMPPETEAEPRPLWISLPAWATGALTIIALLFALLAQLNLSSLSAEPAVGMRLYSYAVLTLLFLAWGKVLSTAALSTRWRTAGWRHFPRRRWLYWIGLGVILVSYRLATGQASQSISLLLWVSGIVIAFVALGGSTQVIMSIKISRFSLFVSAVLFLLALLPRTLLLTSLPWILNGAEASIGLDALNVAGGFLRNPFSTGWLTNPTLPLFLLALPIKLFGPTVLGIRALSPLIGALTVVLTFLFGRKLWGQPVGLIAAILLAGSHFHVQYSRLGMTNVWDPMAMLLALGLMAVAWQETDARQARNRWLAAGLSVGLNAYLFTSSHLLPLTLAAAFLVMLALDRPALKQRWRHLITALAIALAVSLPQILYYRNSPSVFMERANTLGILEGQSGWLAREADRTGQEPLTIFWDQLRRASLAFNYEMDKSPSYRPQAPLVGFGPAILFVLGFAIAISRLRKLRYSLLVAWVLIVVIFAGALLIETPSSHRLVIVSPALFILAGIALSELGSLIMQMFDRRSGSVDSGKRWAHYLLPIMVILAAMMSIGDMIFYFGQYRAGRTFGDRNTEIGFEIAEYLNTLEGDWTVFFHGPPSMYVGFPTITYLARDFRNGVNLFDIGDGTSEVPKSNTTKIVHLYLPERFGEYDVIHKEYPNGTLLTFNGSFSNPLFYAYEIRR